MQKPDVKGFSLLLFWHMALYALWTLPAWILLVLHSLLILWTRYCVRHHTPVPGNKNPYSQTVRDPYAAMRKTQGDQGDTPFSIETNN